MSRLWILHLIKEYQPVLQTVNEEEKNLRRDYLNGRAFIIKREERFDRYVGEMPSLARRANAG